MTRYDAGRRLEYKARDVLTEAGYFVVRSAGSKGPVDLVALLVDPHAGKRCRCIRPDRPRRLLVQCKRDGALAPAKWNELYELAQQTDAVAVLAEFFPRGPVLWWKIVGPKTVRGPQPMERFEVAA